MKRPFLSINSTFKFKCFKGISCFGNCCRTSKLLLHPYDILPMKKRLGITSEEFLEKYTYFHIDELTSKILVILKMPCPFVSDKGCTIYAKRPVECRYFPIGPLFYKNPTSDDDKFDIAYLLNEGPHCLGLQTDSEWTIKAWKTSQGLDELEDLHREWKEIKMMADMSSELDQAQIYIAGYDLDRFRRFIFDSSFLNIVDVEDEELSQIKTNDFLLMKFSFKYLKHVFSIEKTLKIKQDSKLQFDKIIREITHI
jgi:uncharacterized protein